MSHTTDIINPPSAPSCTTKALTYIIKGFSSFKIILPMMFFYALSCAIATFIDNDYGSSAAYSIVYGSWWFFLLHVYLIIALLASLARAKSIQRKRYATLVLHLSFIIIIIGAGITRYYGKEGLMWIEEGQSSHYYYSSDNYLNITALNDEWQKDYVHIPANLSVFRGFFTHPTLHAKAMIFGKELRIIQQDIAFAKHTQEKNAPMALRLLVSYNGESKVITIIGGNGTYEYAVTREEIGGMKMSFHWGARKVGLPFGVRLLAFEKKTYAGTDNPSSYASEVEVLHSDGSIIKPFRIFMNHVLDFKGYRFYQSDYSWNDETKHYTSVLSVNNDPGKLPTYIGYTLLMIGALWLLFDKNGRFLQLARFLARENLVAMLVPLCFTLGYITQAHAISPHIDTHGKEQENTLLQSTQHASTPSKQASNAPHNASSSSKNTLDTLEGVLQFLKEQHVSEQNLAPFIRTWNDIHLPAQQITQEHRLERLALLREHSKDFANRLRHIQVQDYAGRIEPLDTLAMQIMHKIARKDSYEGLDNMQVLIGLMFFSNDFANANLIYTKTPKLRAILGVPKQQVYVSLLDIYDASTGESKLHNYFVDAQQKKEDTWSSFDKDVRAVTESYEILRSVQNLQLLRIFPDQETKKWFSPLELLYAHAEGRISRARYEELARSMDSVLSVLFVGALIGTTTNAWSLGQSALKSLESYQERYGGQDYVGANRIEWEIFLNHYNIFDMLTLPYILLGVIGLVLVLVYIYKDARMPKMLYRVFFALIALCVLLHTLGLLARWYVAGHSPWSNAYESMIYIAWASGAAGVVFFPRFMLALCATSFFSGVSLFVAHLGYMNPQIQDLVPVLQSYWLNIHVSVITASYGFFGLCFVLGAFTLVLFMLRKSSKPHIDRAIFSVGAINEMTMMLGLFLLTIGNFLGAIWANESWGRYWGWDPKETWALIAIGIYAIVLHLRFIRFAYLPFVFAVGSVLAFYSILMTYFGVNYYLAGKHSYAAGDPIPMPWEVYAFIALTITLIFLASRKRHLQAPNI